jgi:SP family galactose:H+ symporter-like MFS transporter
VIGALLSGLFARFLGRKKSLVLAGLIFCTGAGLSAMIPPMRVMMICRFALGFSVGISSFIVPLYLSETAPAKIRGSMGTLFQLMITIGIFLISVTNVFIIRAVATPENALPLMFGVIVSFAALMFIGCLLLPESPRWLMLKGRRDAAVRVLRRVLNSEAEVASEIGDIERALAGVGAKVTIVFKGYFIKILLVGIVLQMFQQLVGINVMIYYAPTIFGYAGLAGIIGTMTVPTVNMLFTFPAIGLVEKWGRKKLLYVGAVCMFLTMISAGIAFDMVGSQTDASLIGILPKAILLCSVIVYIFGFAVSWGPVAWIVCSEIFPLEGREVGMTITTMVNWTFVGILMDNALTFMQVHGHSSLFFLFSAFCVAAIAFVAMFVPETRGATLERIEQNLRSGKRMRDLGSL